MLELTQNTIETVNEPSKASNMGVANTRLHARIAEGQVRPSREERS